MWIHAAHAEKGCIALSAPLVITNLAAFFLFSFTEFTCSTSGNSHDVRESSGLLTNNLKLWIEFKKQKKNKRKNYKQGIFYHVAARLFLPTARRPCWGCRRGCPVWSSLAWDTPPASAGNKEEELQKKVSKEVWCFSIHRLSFFVRWPVWEIRESTPACRPCRWGSTWRTRSRWCIPLWCSSRGTYSRTAWGVALSGRSWLWYTENSGETLGVPYLKHFHIC